MMEQEAQNVSKLKRQTNHPGKCNSENCSLSWHLPQNHSVVSRQQCGFKWRPWQTQWKLSSCKVHPSIILTSVTHPSDKSLLELAVNKKHFPWSCHCLFSRQLGTKQKERGQWQWSVQKSNPTCRCLLDQKNKQLHTMGMADNCVMHSNRETHLKPFWQPTKLKVDWSTCFGHCILFKMSPTNVPSSSIQTHFSLWRLFAIAAISSPIVSASPPCGVKSQV